MAVRWLAGILVALAPFVAYGAGAVHGIMKPFDTTPKRVERLVLDAPRGVAELALPALGEGAKRSLDDGSLKPNQVGISRLGDVAALPSLDASRLTWTPVADGYVTQIRVSSPGAEALRVGLRFDAMPADLQIRVAPAFGAPSSEVVATSASHLFKLTGGAWPIRHWTASTDGPAQVIELWSARRPTSRELEVHVEDASHIFRKVLDFACHVDIACIADANVRQDGRGVARMRFVEDGRAFVCTGSLLNDASSSMTPLFATANHCISTMAVANSLETWFFFYPDTCNGVPAAPTRLTGGATLLQADFDTDFTLLRLMQSAPGGAFFLGWDPAPIPVNTSVFGIHHPNGEAQRYMAGTMTASVRIRDSETGITFAQPYNRITFTQGIVEGGSSGSPLLTAPSFFRGTLFGSPASNACDVTSTGSYSDFSIAFPLVSTFLAGPGAADDHADVPGAATTLAQTAKLVGQINRDGDPDWFRVTFTAAGDWTIRSYNPATGGTTTDVIGEVYASDGFTRLAASDDRSATDRNFEIVQPVTPGTYFLRVTGQPGITGAYGLSSAFALPDDYGNSPANAANLNSNTVIGGFLGSATDEDWFRISFAGPGQFRVISSGTTDIVGRLYRSDGTTLISEIDDIDLGVNTNFMISANVNGADTYFLQVTGFDGDLGNYALTTSFINTNIAPNYTDLWWNPNESGWGINLNHQTNTIFATLFTYAADNRGLWLVASDLTRQPDGTFTGALYRTTGPVFNAQPWTPIMVTQVGTMTLTFSSDNAATLAYSFNGTNVTKQITRQRFGPSPTCVFITGPRTGATNFQDLWYIPAESGWGINLTHEGNIIFATLFTYGADNRDMWLVADSLTRQPDDSYTGNLLRTTGPVFNAQPWTPINVTTVGTMTLRFSTGQSATLTYSVDGVNVTKQISRQVFGTQPTQCY